MVLHVLGLYDIPKASCKLLRLPGYIQGPIWNISKALGICQRLGGLFQGPNLDIPKALWIRREEVRGNSVKGGILSLTVFRSHLNKILNLSAFNDAFIGKNDTP